MAIVNKKTITAEEFIGKLLPSMEMMKDQALRDMKQFASEGRDYLMIFRDVEFRIPLAEVEKYLAGVKDLDSLITEFDAPPAADEIVPPPPGKPKRDIPKEFVAPPKPVK